MRAALVFGILALLLCTPASAQSLSPQFHFGGGVSLPIYQPFGRNNQGRILRSVLTVHTRIPIDFAAELTSLPGPSSASPVPDDDLRRLWILAAAMWVGTHGSLFGSAHVRADIAGAVGVLAYRELGPAVRPSVGLTLVPFPFIDVRFEASYALAFGVHRPLAAGGGVGQPTGRLGYGALQVSAAIH